MDSIGVENNRVDASARSGRLKLLGFGVLTFVAGVGLAAAAGPPRMPSGVPSMPDALQVLAGATLPLDALLVVLVDAAWAIWTWIVLSLLLEVVLLGAEMATEGRSRWVHALRSFANRASMPLARRTVAAAFAVQVISRGVPIAAAQTLPPVETLVVSTSGRDGDASGGTLDDSVSASTYLVRPGDTLWSIAEQAYGSGTAYPRLVEANVGRRMPDGHVFSARGVIHPGWLLMAPGATWQVQVVDGQRWYTVQPGDTLSSIATSVLGDPLRWPELFELNRGAATGDGRHVLDDANTIWPGLRLRLADTSDEPEQAAQAPTPPQPAATELRAASAPPTVADRHLDDSPTEVDPPTTAHDAEQTPQPISLPPLHRTHHDQAIQPVVLDSSDALPVATDADPTPGPPEAAGGGTAGDTEVSLPAPPWRPNVPGLPLALGGLGLAGVAGLAFGARRMRRLRPLPQEPESEVVVEGGFAEAQLAHDLTRGLHGIGFDPVAALVNQLQQFLAESGLFESSIPAVLAARHGRSSTTITLRCGLAEQPLLLELAQPFAQALDAQVEACVSADQDVLWRLMRLRKTRLLPSVDSTADEPCLVPLGVLYDRQMYSVAWGSLGHVLVASLPGHGADTIVTSLVATLTARRSPTQLQVWMLSSARALQAPLFALPHLVRVVDPADEAALLLAAENLRAELDDRAARATGPDLVVVIPELSSLGPHTARFALLAARAAGARVRFVVGCSDPEQAIADPLTTHLATRMVLRMQTEETSVALLGVADAAFLGGGGRLLLRVDGREPVEMYGYQVAAEHLERLVKVMRSAYASPDAGHSEPLEPPDPPTGGSPSADPSPSAPPPVGAPTTPDEPESDSTSDAGMPANRAATSPKLEADTCQAPIQVYCFGSPRVECAGQTVWPRNGGDAKPWELLLFMASQPEEGVSKDALVKSLWPREDQVEDLGHRLRQLRFRLRRQLQQIPGGPESDGIYSERHMLRMDPGIMHSDVQEFLSLVHSVRVNPGDDAIERLEKARSLYIGDLLTGPDVRRYAWLDERDDSGVTMREHFRRLFETASARLAELYTQAGQLDDAIDVYREVTESDPADELIWQALFRLHARRDDRDALVAEEKRLRQTLRELAEELGMTDTVHADEPGAETTQEYQRLLAGLSEREPAVA